MNVCKNCGHETTHKIGRDGVIRTEHKEVTLTGMPKTYSHSFICECDNVIEIEYEEYKKIVSSK